MAQRKPRADGSIDPRDRVLEAAMTAIAERGLHAVRMSDIAELAAMSPGHILYYFKSKDRILAETLAWSEAQLADHRHAELAKIEDAPGRLVRFVEVYVPTGPRDPRWILWFELYSHASINDEIATLSVDLELQWVNGLADIIALGIRRGEFAPVEPDEFAERYVVLLGGYSMRVVAGQPGATREWTINRVVALAARELGFRASGLRRSDAVGA